VLAPLFLFSPSVALAHLKQRARGSILFAEEGGEVLDGFGSDHGVQLYQIES
jgi:hypothetical protein